MDDMSMDEEEEASDSDNEEKGIQDELKTEGLSDDDSEGEEDDKKGGLKTEGLSDDDNEGEDDSTGSVDDLSNVFDMDQTALKEGFQERCKADNEDVLVITTSKPIVHKGLYYGVMFVGDQSPCWYNIHEGFKASVEYLLEVSKKKIPGFIENLRDHKLRVEYSPTNEMQFRTNNTKYPNTRWCSVIKLNAVNPEKHLELEVEKFSKIFKQMYADRPGITPGGRWMTYVTNGGMDRILTGCRKYMGDDDSNIERVVNEELIALGNKTIVYHTGCHLDKFWTDQSIKMFLEYYLGASSWDDVSQKVKKACFKNYPNRELPNWDRIVN